VEKLCETSSLHLFLLHLLNTYIIESGPALTRRTYGERQLPSLPVTIGVQRQPLDTAHVRVGLKRIARLADGLSHSCPVLCLVIDRHLAADIEHTDPAVDALRRGCSRTLAPLQREASRIEQWLVLQRPLACSPTYRYELRVCGSMRRKGYRGVAMMQSCTMLRGPSARGCQDHT